MLRHMIIGSNGKVLEIDDKHRMKTDGVAPASAWSDETASPATSIILPFAQHLPYAAVAGVMNRVDLDDAVILGENYAFGIDTILEPAAGFEATVFGYFIDA